MVALTVYYIVDFKEETDRFVPAYTDLDGARACGLRSERLVVDTCVHPLVCICVCGFDECLLCVCVELSQLPMSMCAGVHVQAYLLLSVTCLRVFAMYLNQETVWLVVRVLVHALTC